MDRDRVGALGMKYEIQIREPPVEEMPCTCYVCQEFHQVEREVDWEIVNTRWSQIASQLAASLIEHKKLLLTNEWLETAHIGSWLDLEFAVHKQLTKQLDGRDYTLCAWRDELHSGTMLELTVVS